MRTSINILIYFDYLNVNFNKGGGGGGVVWGGRWFEEFMHSMYYVSDIEITCRSRQRE